MVTIDDVFNALKRCSGYAPQIAPQPSEAVAAAWMEHFEDYPGVTGDDLRLAVKEFFRTPRERMIQPADISSIARKYSRERIEMSALDSEERLRLEAICDAKAAPDTTPAIEASPVAVSELMERHGLPGTNRDVEKLVAAVAERRGLDATAQMKIRDVVESRRRAAPPVPLPCPDCGEVAIPCSCPQD